MKISRKLNEILPYLSIILGILIYWYWLLQIKKIYWVNFADLPVKIGLLPPQILYWIAIVLIASPFVIFSVKIHLRIISLLVLLFLTLFSFPLLSPYGLPYGRDSEYVYQSTQILLENKGWIPFSGTGHSKIYNNYPALYTYIWLFSDISNISILESSMWAFSIIRFLLLPLILYLFFKEVLETENRALLGVFLYFTSPSLTNHPHHEGFAIIFFIATLYFLVKILKNNLPIYKALFILSGIMVVISHHFTSYLLLTWLAFISLFGFLYANKFILGILTNMKNISSHKNFPFNGFIILVFVMGLWIAFISRAEFAYYFSGLDEAFAKSINPKVKDFTALNEEIISPKILNQTTAFNNDEENITEIVSIPSPIVQKTKFLGLKLEAIKENMQASFDKLLTLLDVGNFKAIEIFIIILSALIFIFLLIYGITSYFKLSPPVMQLNLIFCLILIFISFLVVTYSKYFIFKRFFEFVYIGFVPFLVLAIEKLYQKNFLKLKPVLPLLLLILLIGGNLMLVGGQQRYYYVSEDKITLDNTLPLITPSSYQSSLWVKTRFYQNDSVGETYVFDTIGAFGFSEVHIHEPALISGLFATNRLTERTLLRLKYDKIEIIITDKYMTKYRTNRRKAYSNSNIQKFNYESWLDNIYSTETFDIYRINEIPV